MNEFSINFESPENMVLLPEHSAHSVSEIDSVLQEFGIGGAVVFQTSGTGGTARLVQHSKRGLRCSAEAVNAHLQATPDDVWLCALPVHHVGGFGVHARALCSNSGVYAMSGGWDPEAYVAHCQEKSATLSSLVPTQVFDLVQCNLRCPSDLRAVVVGGGRLDGRLETGALALGWPILKTYGLSEAGSQVATQRGDCLELLPHLEARLSATGCLQLRGASIAESYLSRADGGDWLQVPLLGSDGWFTTDDLVEIDGRELRFLGRASTRVKVLGELVDVEALEAAFLSEFGEPNEVALIAVRDARAEHVIAVVHSNGVDRDQVLARMETLNASLAGFERITQAFQVREIPRGELGKVRRAELLRLMEEAEK